tara:strand:+ start:30399 stop:31376 length:978 start_codon:yes stop_codon:yes gene_type:complete
MKKLPKNKISVGIIGLGNIGMSFDNVNDPISFKTHVKAFYFSKKFEIDFVLDSDSKKIKIAKKNYPEIKNFVTNLEEINVYPELIVLCSSESSNLQYFELLKNNINYFFVEKPFRLNNSNYYISYNDKVVINYYRKFSPFYNDLRDQIESNDFGNIRSINIKYSKGIFNTLTHFIDLLLFLFDNSLVFNDFTRIDKNLLIDNDEIAFSFLVKNITKFNAFAVFQSINFNDLYFLEIDLIFERKRFLIQNYESEIIEYEIKEDENFPDYKNFIKKRQYKISNIDYMKNVVEKIPDIIYKGIPNIFSLKQDKKVLQIISLINNFKEN